MTDWNSLDFPRMYQAVHEQNAYRQRSSAEGWKVLARQFEAMRDNLGHYSKQIAPDWNSSGGDAFREKMADVQNTLNSYAAAVRQFAEMMYDTADAVIVAQNKMNEINSRRAKYIAQKEDAEDAFSDDTVLGNIFVDPWEDLWNNRPDWMGGEGFIDPNKLAEFDEEARTAMRTLENAYLLAEESRPQLPAYKGPLFAAKIPSVPGAPNIPGSPNIPNVPVVPVIPPSPTLPTDATPTPTPPVAPPPPVVPPPPGVPPVPGPELVGTPAPPAPPVLNPPTVPPAPNAPGVPIPPLVPGLHLPGQPGLGNGGGGAPRVTPPAAPNLPGKGQRPGLGAPPSPGRNSMKKSGVIGQRPGAPGKPALPPSAGTGKGVIGKRPTDGSQRGGAQPPAAGQQRRGQPATPPPSQRGRGGTGRGATPPPAGQRPGVIGRRPGQDGPGQHGTPPPAQRRDRRNTENQPTGQDGIPGTIGPGNTAWGTPPPTISNTSRPTRPTSMDHDAIGGRPQGGAPRRQQPGADGDEFTRRPGLAARDAAPPVLGRERQAQPAAHGEPPAARRSHQSTPLSDDEYGVTEAETATPVIHTPEQQERDERGPAIGQAG
ncbi:hypothetical protein [Actinoplanes sp. GCM10030250]|uniref:hypothetical protein n=1 Tax=Actinoplanes sp. GCM10030250 TaxID=3273376 RepID=UPI00360E4E84